MGELTTLDNVVLVLMGLMIARGLWIGLIREGFSIAALGGGLIAVRYGIEPVAAIVENAAGGRLGATTSLWVAGALIAFVVIAAVATAGKLLRKGVHAVGLGLADRIGGGVVGAAEGALASAVIVLGTIWVIGEDDPVVTNSRAVEILEQLQEVVANSDAELPDVASPRNWIPKKS